MFRTAIFSALTGISLFVPATVANAASPVVIYPNTPVVYYPSAPNCRTWTVLYRGCNREQWRTYRSYSNPYWAERAAHNLRLYGFEVFVSVTG